MPIKTTRTAHQPDTEYLSVPGFFRHIAAVLYDLLLLVAILFAATAILLPFNEGVAFTKNQYFYSAYLFAVSFLFYGWFWTHGGQTLGLRTWKITVLNPQQQTISWLQAFVRFVTAILSWSLFGLGFFWRIIDKRNRTLYDLISKTQLYYHPDN